MNFSFLLQLPREIRDYVYAFALKYETPVEVEEGAWRSAPALLKTCKQISAEAIPLYYDINTFIHHIGGHMQWNGVTWDMVHKRSLNFSKIKNLVINLQHLRNWDPPREYEVACRKKVARLAHALFGIPGMRIEVRGLEEFCAKYDTTEVLEPLAILRRVQSIQIPGVFENPWAEEENDFFREFVPLVTGDSPTESCFKMYRNLKAYALSFERHHKRRLFMDSEALLLRGWPDWKDHSSYFDLAMVSNLQRARAAGEEEDRITFRFRRRHVLFYLERQYLQIKIEKYILFNAVDNLQRDAGRTRAQELCRYHFQDTDPINSPMVGFRAFLALVRFANSFRRIPQMMNSSVSVLPPDDHVYDNMDREIALTKLYNAAAYEGNLSMTQRLARKMAHKSEKLYDWTVCIRYFKSALKDMLAQYDDILRTRRHIFKDDIVTDISYKVHSWEFEDNADTVYGDDDPDKPTDIQAQELLFGTPDPLPDFTHPMLDKAHLLASQEPPSPLIDVGPSKGVFYRPLPGVPTMSWLITLFDRVPVSEGQADRREDEDPCAYRDPTWPDSESADPWCLNMLPLTRSRSTELVSAGPETSDPPARHRRRSF